MFVLAIFFVVRPFEDPGEAVEKNAALAWGATIERLGMRPLYPPQEDFFVGDIYITLEDPGTEVGGKAIRYPSTAYKGRGVRIGHIDMRTSIAAGNRAAKFGNASVVQSSAISPKFATSIDESGPISLSLVTFPGISIKRHIDTDSSFWRFFAGRRTGEVEEISIPSAETYSAPVIDSLVALGNYCSDEATADFCDDAAARKILSYTLGPDVNAIHDKKYIFPISISIVGQVFLTSRLKISRYNGDALSTKMSDDAQTDDQQSASGGSSKSEANETTKGRPSSGSARYESMYSNRIHLDEPFARPLVFGFRAVSFALPKSDPFAALEVPR